jgi:hypothetical protein
MQYQMFLQINYFWRKEKTQLSSFFKKSSWGLRDFSTISYVDERRLRLFPVSTGWRKHTWLDPYIKLQRRFREILNSYIKFRKLLHRIQPEPKEVKSRFLYFWSETDYNNNHIHVLPTGKTILGEYDYEYEIRQAKRMLYA